jgi:hypothetical protein
MMVPDTIHGVNEIEVGTLDVTPDYVLEAVRLEIVNPAGDGIRVWVDMPLALDLALRLIGAYMRLRGLTP